MSKNVNINVHHLTRVEGHGNIVVNVSNGKIEKCEWQVPEAPRFFEAMVRGRHYSEVPRITSRICGICSVGHTLVACKAAEDALGMHMTEQTVKLRSLLKHAENFDSHVVHSLFLAAPDLLGVKSVFPLVPTHGEVVKAALRLKRFGHEWGSLIAGRTTHPTKCVPGGFASVPTTKEIVELRRRLEHEALPDLLAVFGVVLSLADKFPAFERKTEYIAVHSKHEYGLYDGDIQCLMPDGSKEIIDVHNYRSVTNEYISPLSTAKYAKHKMGSYFAGALARFNNNFDQLHPAAKDAAAKLGMKPICFNTYLNTAAQVVECVHNVFEGIRLCEELAAKGIKDEPLAKATKHGVEGAALIEVPRGILFHSYTFDKDGMCVNGNCIIPTNQNHGNIQADFEKLLPEMLNANKTEKEIELGMEMMVRAYDPCISCSTHYLKVEFKR
jgi:coenzyme F420-reducing hydrogenase alpha subunit